jgi:hypothetical protein
MIRIFLFGILIFEPVKVNQKLTIICLDTGCKKQFDKINKTPKNKNKTK